VAAQLLRGHFAASGDWYSAAARYHRPAGGAPAARYRSIFGAHLSRLWPASRQPLAVMAAHSATTTKKDSR